MSGGFVPLMPPDEVLLLAARLIEHDGWTTGLAGVVPALARAGGGWCVMGAIGCAAGMPTTTAREFDAVAVGMEFYPQREVARLEAAQMLAGHVGLRAGPSALWQWNDKVDATFLGAARVDPAPILAAMRGCAVKARVIPR